MASISSNEERRLAYFHALGKTMTENVSQQVYESNYKSAHNVRLSEIWSDEIAYAATLTDAINQSLTNSAITYYNMVQLTQIPGSNGMAYYFNSGGTFIRPWVSPVDVPQPLTNLPSNGFEFKLFNGAGSPIPTTSGAWVVDYYAGIVHFGQGFTPSNLGWGNVKGSFFEYTGAFGASGSTVGFTTVVFDSGSSQLIFDSGMTNQVVIDLSPLKSSGGGGKLATANKNMAANTTTSGSTLACSIGVLQTTLSGSSVAVFINGIQVNVGSLSTDDCYFSPNGLVVRSTGQELVGDRLYWRYVGGLPVSGYNLDATRDSITFMYLTT